MRKFGRKSKASPDAFLTRLARDKAGNTLALMAAAIVPLIGFTGAAIDVARLYVVKARLQQACDAGVLAGRKFMTDNTLGTPLDSTASAQAQAFFRNNFQNGFFEASNVAFTPTKVADNNSSVANAVNGTATATVPMAVMRFFDVAASTLDVTCRAQYDLADTDIMFVLDTTGSMACKPSDPTNCTGSISYYQRSDGSWAPYAVEKSDSKLDGLRDAVILFDETMRDEADSTTKFRYGFVPYAASVNAGGVIPAQYLEKGTATYNTRWPHSEYNFGSATAATQTTTNVTQAECTMGKRNPASGYKLIGTYYGAYKWTGTPTWSSTNGGTCTGVRQTVRVTWRYGAKALDVSTYATGADTVNPSRLDGSTSRWRGCIEEIATRTDATFTDIDNLPPDLDPDVVPDSTTGKWKPTWPEAVWTRNSIAAQDVQDGTVSENVNSYSTSAWYNNNYGAQRAAEKSILVGCGMPAKTLSSMSADDVDKYVKNDDFRAYGYTYHDLGMAWGVRMLSPNGVFASTTAAHPGRNAPNRVIVFMTDGTLMTQPFAYTPHGIEAFDNRTGGQDDARHNERFKAVCNYAKTRLGITIYVVAFGVNLNSNLTTCASPGQAFKASSTAELNDAFRRIAQRVAMLRITR